MKRQIILAFMLDRPGVLNKISMLIRRKMFNVDTLTVCEGKRKGISRMTISVHNGDQDHISQVAKQIEKLTEVISAQVLDYKKSYEREIALIKVKDEGFKFLDENHEFKILENLDGKKIVQVTDETQEIDNFLKIIGKSNIIEIARTGVTAIEK